MANTVYTPDLEELILVPEGTLVDGTGWTPTTFGAIQKGGAVDTPTQPILCIPEVGTLVTTIVGAPLQGNFSVGRAFSNFDRRAIIRNGTVAFNTWFRANGEVPYLIASMLGFGSDSGTSGAGTAPVTHPLKPALLTTRGLTYSVFHDVGGGQLATNPTMLWLGGGSTSQLDFTFAPDAAMGVAVQMETLMAVIETGSGNFPSVPAISTSRPPIPTMGFTGTVTIPDLAGNADYPTGKKPVITGASFSFQKPIGLCKSIISGVGIGDIVPGPLTVTGSISFEYNGLLAGAIHDDFLAQKQQGTAANHLIVTFTDDAANFWSMELWPFLIDDLTLSTNQTYLEGTITLGPFNDMNTATKGSGQGATSPVVVNVKNSWVKQLG